MFLADPTQIREDLGFDDMPDINEAIVNALQAATSLLAARLDTDFTLGQQVDTFHLPFEEPYRRRLATFVNQGPALGSARPVVFRLSRGFVSAVTAVTAPEAGALSVPGALSVTPAATSGADALERGVLRDFQTSYVGGFVQISYTYGFPASATDPRMFDLTVVPAWLQDAAKLRAKTLLAGSPSLEEAAIKIDTKTLGMEYGALVSRHLRYAPTSISPL